MQFITEASHKKRGGRKLFVVWETAKGTPFTL